ncbi:MAG: complex I subunit 5 family protein [Rubrobacteraceae bacterium]
MNATGIATGILLMLLWLLPSGVPLLLSIALAPRRLRPLAEYLAPLAALPAFLIAVFARPGSVVEVPLLLGIRLGLTGTTQLFLLFSAGLWLLAGLYARAYLEDDPTSGRFFGFFLATMAGNLGLIVARDVVSFYLFFILMSFAAYGMIVHDRTPRAFRAGRVYVVFVVIGETFLLPAMILISVAAGAYRLEEVPAAVAGSPLQGLIVFLLFAGFGTKVGVLLLHFSLPLAYPASPPPAGAALGGPMIKAGLLGWLIFLPVGETGTTLWGTVVAVFGIAAAFYGVVVGLTQRTPGTVLAYSSISQMGWITAALGIGLLSSEAWPVALVAILVYAAHHALAKSSLFLGLGVARRARNTRARRLALGGLLVGALALAGAPLTSGAVAKYFLKEATGTTPGSWPVALEALLQIGAIGTTLLMGRFLFAVRPGSEAGKLSAGLWLPWVAQLALVTAGILMLPGGPLTAIGLTLSFSTFWPLAAGVLLIFGYLRLRQRTGIGTGPRIPEGDLLVPFVRLLEHARRAWNNNVYPSNGTPRRYNSQNGSYGSGAGTGLIQVETSLRYWAVAGTLFVMLVVVLVVLVGVL